MNYRRLFALLLLVTFTAANISAGGLSEQLNEKLKGVVSSEFVPVWIKLHPSINAATFKTRINASASTRAQRYKIASNELRLTHTNAQSGLLNFLENWQAAGLAANVRGHWLVNVVEADVRADRLDALSKRTDIEIIHAVPKIVSIESESPKTLSSPSAAGASNNLLYINAHLAWADGYTGAGRVICSFDTGVDGDHPALINGWKGNNGDSAAAWFDPLDQEPFPHQVTSNHGTRSMGLIVGHDDATGDTTGVAIDAKWISAAVMDVPGTSLIDGFEWAADPDGNPNTVDDLPDVINHSWGALNIGCENMFYDLIDASEALGIVHIFAAGNEGKGGSFDDHTIRNPANRALTNIDCFAVGNIEHDKTPPDLANSSSRGPSDCNEAIKPNVCAPGTGVRTTLPGGGYTNSAGGTSFAAPQVAGLVALLRQKNPNATVDEIKTAILTTTQTYGMSLPNNDFGWGVIDCMAALDAISSVNAVTNVRVYAFDHADVIAGEIASGWLSLQNLGASVSSVTATITGSNDALTILNGIAGFGTISESEISQSTDLLRIEVSDTVSVGSRLGIDLTISGSGYNVVTKLYVVVGESQQRSKASHTLGNITFTVTNYGTYGLGGGSFFPAGGDGFKLGGVFNDLYEAGLMIGKSSSQVSDGVRNIIGEPDGDFKVMAGGDLDYLTPGTYAPEETNSRFSDTRAESPINIEVTQNSYSYDTFANNDFLILQYIIKNLNPTTLTGIYAGLYFDWDIKTYYENAGGYDNGDEIIWTAFNNGATLSDFRGIKVLNGVIASALTQTATEIIYPEFGGDGFTELEKFEALTFGFDTIQAYVSAREDLNQVISAGPITLAAGASVTVAFAIVAGANQDDFLTAASQAVLAYGLSTDVDDQSAGLNLPERFTLYQNFPNPFNPTTEIAFDLPVASEYSLSIYNLLGQQVDNFTGRAKAGTVKISWSGDDHSSGVYFYKLTAGDYSSSKKMILLK